eukprot:scaffold5528_cov27-Tisochrysis_lutea.AAC.1
MLYNRPRGRCRPGSCRRCRWRREVEHVDKLGVDADQKFVPIIVATSQKVGERLRAARGEEHAMGKIVSNCLSLGRIVAGKKESLEGWATGFKIHPPGVSSKATGGAID